MDESTFTFNTEKNQTQLKDFVKSANNSALTSLVIGVLLILTGLGAACLLSKLLLHNDPDPCTCWCYYYHSRNNLYAIIIIAAIIEAGAIICLLAYKNSSKQIAYYRDELIVLRDLQIAWEISSKISDLDLKDETLTGNAEHHSTIKNRIMQRTKMQELMIQTLLDRCAK